GVPAIRTLIGEGININVTLLFGIAAYEQVAEAYIAGLEAQAQKGGDIARMASVASFFVSRIDALVDKRIDVQLARDGDRAGLEALRGTVAIANAKLAYVRYKEIISGARWEALAEKGAQPQRLLWASTSTKNPAYPDTLYVETLIGQNTVNTMPPATMDAFRDHGRVEPDTVEQGVEDARRILAALEQHGISLRGVTDELVEDGVKQFADAFDKLLGSIGARSRSLKAAS
ncbi:MAG: transaldolase, partial [Acetobacteraceae bacterium]|nr:transaldolase [Acetobacteraceae bacterium]